MCSKSFCEKCYRDGYHENIESSYLTKMYGTWYNGGLETITKEKGELFNNLRYSLGSYIRFDEDFCETLETHSQYMRRHFRNLILELRIDHNTFQKELKQIKERFIFELAEIVLQKRIRSADIVGYILDFL